MRRMQSAHSPLTGTLLDSKYRLLEEIGQGGMGAVYRAQHVGTLRPVAIKVLLSGLVSDAQAVERFRREARAAGGLRHPNVVDVTDFGVASVAGSDIAYIAMEHLEGSTLRAMLDASGALPIDLVLDVVEQIAAALESAHSAGIVHRDLKPENVWLVHDARGGHEVRVLDFGIALIGSESVSELASPGPAPIASAAVDPATTGIYPCGGEGAQPETSSGRLTVAGSIVGTPHYMSPEQCRGEALGAATDIYALGILSWEMIAGRRPFRGEVDSVIRSHLEETPPPLPRGPAPVSDVLVRALAKSPGQRFDSASAFAGNLRVAAEGPGVVLRRSISLYADRFGEFFRISWHCSRVPVALATALFAMLVMADHSLGLGPRQLPHAAVIAALVFWAGCWLVATMFTNACFALALDRLRTHPLERLDPGVLQAELRERLGLERTAGYARTAARLVFYYLRCEGTSKAGAGDLAFVIGLLERLPFADIPRRCAELHAVSRGAYRRVGGAVLLTVIALPLIEFCVLVQLLPPADPASRAWAMSAALSLTPLGAAFVNPIFGSAFAIQYFRARQAKGEGIPIAAMLRSRL